MPSWPGWAGWPPGRVLLRLTFSCGRSRCSLSLLVPLQAWVALLVVFPAFFFSLVPPPCLRHSGFCVFLALVALDLGVLGSPAPFVFFSFLFFPHTFFPACFFCVFFFLFSVFLLPFFLSSLPCPGVLGVRYWGGLSLAMGRVGVCYCGPGASAEAGVRLRSVARCALPVLPPFVLVPVVFRAPGGAALAAFLFPVLPLVGAVWCAPPPSGALRGVFLFLSGVC